MKNMHTPGPWKLCHHLQSEEKDKTCSCGYRGGIWGFDEEHIVCEIGCDDEMIPRYNRDIELANAKLIAASPILLITIKALLPHINDRFMYDRAVEAIKLAE